MKIEDFRPIRSQDSAPIKFDWLLTQESDWIIWTNQKITLIIFWLVKNGKDWNPAIPLVKRIFLVPDHIWPKTIKGQPALTHVIRNYVLLLVVPPLCLWWVTHAVTKALRLKILPGQQLPLFPNPPLYWLVTQQANRGNLADQLRLLQLPQPGTHQHRPHTEDAVTPTNSLHQGDRPASPANQTGTRRGDSVIADVIMTLSSRRVSSGQKRQPNNTFGAAAVHPMTNCRPNDGRTKEYRKKWIFTLCTTAALGVNVRE